MSRLDYCQYELVDDCYDWKNDHCDECNIFKAYCEGAIRAKNSIVRCKDCHFAHDDITHLYCDYFGHKVYEDDYCSHGERKEPHGFTADEWYRNTFKEND